MLEKVPARVLASRVIASVEPELARALGVSPGMNALAMFTVDHDDVGYVAVDEATKQADVEVVHASSFYAGAAHASGPYSGEFIGILAAPTPSDAAAGLRAATACALHDAAFTRAPGNPDLVFFAHLVSACGSYFAAKAGIEQGSAMAYLIAPPLEATLGLDSALKAAGVRMVRHFPPPTETNFSGAWVTGSQADCLAACEAFQDAVLSVAARPLEQ